MPRITADKYAKKVAVPTMAIFDALPIELRTFINELECQPGDVVQYCYYLWRTGYAPGIIMADVKLKMEQLNVKTKET